MQFKCVHDNPKIWCPLTHLFPFVILVVALYTIFVDTSTEFICLDPSGFLSLYLLSGTFGHLGTNSAATVGFSGYQDVHAKPY